MSTAQLLRSSRAGRERAEPGIFRESVSHFSAGAAPAFVVGNNLTTLELFSNKASSQNPSALQTPAGSYSSRTLERCRWETKVFMHAWQKMEKRAGILLRSKADLERIVDGAVWKLLPSVKMDLLLESSEPSRKRVNNCLPPRPSPSSDFYSDQGIERQKGVRVALIGQLQKTGTSSP
jgi:hypothetical protein